jgi:hypothetical protein
MPTRVSTEVTTSTTDYKLTVSLDP